MSSDWETSAQAERIKQRRQKLEAKRRARAESDPLAFAWEEKDGQYHCDHPNKPKCDKTCKTLAGMLEHIQNHELGEGQTGLDQW